MIVWDRELYHSWGNSPKQKNREKQYNAEYYKKHRAKILADRKKNKQKEKALDKREAALNEKEKAFENKQNSIMARRKKKLERRRKRMERIQKERMQRIKEANFNRQHQVRRVYGANGRLIGLKKLSKSKPKRKK